MELREKVAQLPLAPGVYLYKDAGGRVIYVGKAKSLRHRVRSYFSDDKLADVKTGTLISEARDVDYILVDNEKEALALENNLIKQYKPRFNILLRDDKTYPYIKLTSEKYPRVYVTRRLRRTAPRTSALTFPANLAHRLVHFIHRHFLVPSCKVDLTRFHPKPCLQYPHSPLPGPVRAGPDHRRSLRRRGARRAAVPGRPPQRPGARAARPHGVRVRRRCGSRRRPACATCSPRWRRSRSGRRWPPPRATTSTFSPCYAEPPLVALNLFHLRNGQIVDRREFFWEDQHGVRRAAVLLRRCSSRSIWTSSTSRRRSTCRWTSRIARRWRSCSREKRHRRVEIRTPQRGQKKALLDLVETNAKHSFDARFRVLKPSSRAIQEALQDALGSAGRAAPHRVLRHLPHPGHRQGGQHGGVGGRQDEEVRLPQVHHPHGGGQRRFRQHARGGDAALLAAAGGEAADAGAGADRWRPRAVACGGGGAGGDRDHRPAAGVDRQARGDHLRATGRRTSRSCSTASRRSCT